jgi:hypothetical protein
MQNKIATLRQACAQCTTGFDFTPNARSLILCDFLPPIFNFPLAAGSCTKSRDDGAEKLKTKIKPRDHQCGCKGETRELPVGGL